MVASRAKNQRPRLPGKRSVRRCRALLQERVVSAREDVPAGVPFPIAARRAIVRKTFAIGGYPFLRFLAGVDLGLIWVPAQHKVAVAGVGAMG